MGRDCLWEQLPPGTPFRSWFLVNLCFSSSKAMHLSWISSLWRCCWEPPPCRAVVRATQTDSACLSRGISVNVLRAGAMGQGTCLTQALPFNRELRAAVPWMWPLSYTLPLPHNPHDSCFLPDVIKITQLHSMLTQMAEPMDSSHRLA